MLLRSTSPSLPVTKRKAFVSEEQHTQTGLSTMTLSASTMSFSIDVDTYSTGYLAHEEYSTGGTNLDQYRWAWLLKQVSVQLHRLIYSRTVRSVQLSEIRNLLVTKTGFSHCTKMVAVKSHNDFSRPLVEKGVV